MTMTPEQQEALAAVEALAASGGAFGGVLPSANAIGLESPSDFVPGGPIGVSGEFVGPLADRGGIGSPYTQGMDLDVLRGMNTEELGRLQDALVASGLVREVIPGRIDDNTLGGLRTLMAIGNRQAVSWQDVLDGIVRAGGLAGGQDREFEPPPSLVPDYATIAQEVKDTVRKRLGRDPDAFEMQELTAQLTGFHALENEAAQELARIQFEQETTPGVQDGGTVQRVDPGARFRELFESKFRNELDFVQDKQDAQVSREVVQSGVDTLSRMSRGS
jgi:hypothetical protein